MGRLDIGRFRYDSLLETAERRIRSGEPLAERERRVLEVDKGGDPAERLAMVEELGDPDNCRRLMAGDDN